MFYKTSSISPNRNSSPAVIHKQSNPSVNVSLHSQQQQYQPQTYYTSSKTTPLKNQQEQKFEAIKPGITMQTQSQNSPEKIRNNYDLDLQILRNDIIFRDQKIASLTKTLDIANQDRLRLRTALEQKSISCVNKEREIAKLLAMIHQIEIKRGENQVIKDLQYQIDTLKDFIQTNALDKQHSKCDESSHLKTKLTTIQDQLQQAIKQNESLQSYVTDLMKQNKELSQKYAEKCIEYQSLEMLDGQIQIMQKELRGKDEEIEILKNELNNYTSTKDQVQLDQQNEIQKFLNTIKKQYLEDSPKGTSDDLDSINVYRPIYSFQSTEDIGKVEFQRLNK